jgi:hypothetical protein
LCMVLMKVVPFVPGHFNVYEWLAFGIWVLCGLALGRRERIGKQVTL